MQRKLRRTSCYSQSVGRDSLQHELASIGVFALITFKRNCKEVDSDEYDHGNDNCQKDPPAQLNALFKISNTGCHRTQRSSPSTANMQASTTTDQTDITDTAWVH